MNGRLAFSSSLSCLRVGVDVLRPDKEIKAHGLALVP